MAPTQGGGEERGKRGGGRGEPLERPSGGARAMAAGGARAPAAAVVGSLNPAKVEAAGRALARAFPYAGPWLGEGGGARSPGSGTLLEGLAVPSGVRDQPWGDEETERGAWARLEHVAAARPGALALAVEGGVEWARAPGGGAGGERSLECFAWCVARGPCGREGRARTASFPLPPAVSALVAQGVELGEADDRVFRRSGSKLGGGSVGLLTCGLITRADYYEQAFLLSLIPILQPELFPPAQPAPPPRDG